MLEVILPTDSRVPAWIRSIRVFLWDVDWTLDQRSMSGRLQEAYLELRRNLYRRRWGADKPDKLIDEQFSIALAASDDYFEAFRRLDLVDSLEEYLAWLGTVDKPSFVQPNPALVEMFERLRGFSHGVLSNGLLDGAIRTIKNLGLDPNLFSFYITGDMTFGEKPDKRIFEAAMVNTGLPAENHVVIGDNLKADILGGRAVGMRTIWIRGATPDEALGNGVDEGLADAVVASVLEVEKIFRIAA